jgi:hypothetical protein
VPDDSLPDDAAGLRAANAGLPTVVEAKVPEIAGLRAELDPAQERERRLELRLAELGRRLGMGSTDSGTPAPKESPGQRRPCGRGSNPSGSGGRTAGPAASPAVKGKACSGIPSRT